MRQRSFRRDAAEKVLRIYWPDKNWWRKKWGLSEGFLASSAWAFKVRPINWSLTHHCLHMYIHIEIECNVMQYKIV